MKLSVFLAIATVLMMDFSANAQQQMPSGNEAAIESIFTSDSPALEPKDKSLTSVTVKPQKTDKADKSTVAKNSQPAKKPLRNESGIKSDIAAPVVPIFYKRDEIRIVKKSLPKAVVPKPQDEKNTEPKTENSRVENTKPAEPSSPSQTSSDIVAFDTEIRDGSIMYRKNGWFNLSGYSDNSGLMMMFQKSDIYPIVRSEQYAPVDILFIDKYGKITQIMPNVIVANLEQDVLPSSPVLAFLFLKGGTCSAASINAGDEVEYPSLFKKPPVVLSAPTSN